MTTMQDVARLAGVSAKTVSRVYNDDPHVDPDTRARVLVAMESLDYVPNTLATTFRTGRHAAIGVAVPDISDPFFAAIVHAVEAGANERDMAVVITCLGHHPDREQPAVESLLRRQLEGLILAPTGRDHRYLQRWAARIPTVFVDRRPHRLAADSFLEDDRGGAVQATEHLLALHHRRIAFIGDSDLLPTTHNRLVGYCDALESWHVDYDECLVVMGADRRARARDIVSTLAELPEPPTALFMSNARTSMACIPALRDVGLKHLSTIGFGDFPMAEALDPPLTVIDQNPAELGRLAINRVLDRIDHPRRRYRRHNILPVTLIQRESCSTLPGDGATALTRRKHGGRRRRQR
jgi:LacI family transcriptional regulator